MFYNICFFYHHPSNPGVTLKPGLKVIPDQDPEDNPAPSSLPTWIKHNACATIYLQDMSKPERDRLLYNQETKQWSFKPGRKATNKEAILPGFETQLG